MWPVLLDCHLEDAVVVLNVVEPQEGQSAMFSIASSCCSLNVSCCGTE
jgi:hypothetical protein